MITVSRNKIKNTHATADAAAVFTTQLLLLAYISNPVGFCLFLLIQAFNGQETCSITVCLICGSLGLLPLQDAYQGFENSLF